MNFSDIVLVPFDDLTVFHCRGLDRHEFIEPIAGEDKAAWMLGQVARRPHQFAGEIERKPKPVIAKIADPRCRNENTRTYPNKNSLAIRSRGVSI
jgi:hypothetical protein